MCISPNHNARVKLGLFKSATSKLFEDCNGLYPLHPAIQAVCPSGGVFELRRFSNDWSIHLTNLLDIYINLIVCVHSLSSIPCARDGTI